METASPTQSFEEDKDLIKFFVECFDQLAFQDDIRQEGRMEDFDKATEDTLIALNTGGMYKKWFYIKASGRKICCSKFFTARKA